MALALTKLLSGGQSGADRAALDFARDHGIPHGGWCPAGRLAEDGPIPPCYQLRETPSSQYAERTQWNVRDSDGTVVFSIRPELKGGSLATVQFARDFDKPVLHLFSQDRDDAAALELLRFIQDHRIKVLNVAGPRASDEPGVAAFVRAILEKALVAE